jgi:hypothetical protein
VTAALVALAAALVAATGGLITFAALAYRGQSALLNARDIIEGERARAGAAESDLAVTREQFTQERRLRLAVEAQRDDAQRKVREYAEKLPIKDVADELVRLLGTPLGVSPPVPAAAAADRNQAGDGAAVQLAGLADAFVPHRRIP